MWCCAILTSLSQDDAKHLAQMAKQHCLDALSSEAVLQVIASLTTETMMLTAVLRLKSHEMQGKAYKPRLASEASCVSPHSTHSDNRRDKLTELYRLLGSCRAKFVPRGRREPCPKPLGPLCWTWLALWW